MGRVPIIALSAATLVVALLLAAVGAGEASGQLSDWQALALGLTQGATELLPVSSSGHLIVVPWLGDWRFLVEHESFNRTFDVSLHLGTLVAVVVYFAADISRLTGALTRSLHRRRVEGPDERMAWFVVVATIPAALVGVVGESVIEDHLGDPWQIAIFLAVFGVVLWLADRRTPTRAMGDVRTRHAIAMGCAQALALMPGVSRSGITITAGRLLGLDRDSAARFSFLLLVPTVLGASLYTGVKDVLLGELPAGWQGPFAIGILAATGSGLLAIDGLLGYVRRHSYAPFAVYRLLAALVILLLVATGAREASF